jgi:ADP-heptose:LPS heptosyltransferase
MHFLETHALNCGAKIDKPFIYTSFFPLPIEKYITFHSDSPATAKNYDYLQDVINIIYRPLEQHGIKIVQVGDPKDRNFSNCASLKGALNSNQLAFIIQNSMLHFGADGFPLHLAGGFDIPLVGIFVNNFINCDKPYFGSPEKQILISSYNRTENKKPSFSNDEMPKTVNLIKPEEIAASILKLLGIDYTIPFESLFFGKKYSIALFLNCWC